MILATTEGVAGRATVETLGLVRGSTVRSKHVGSDIVASLRNVVGGEIPEYSQLMAAAREQALDRMVAAAAALGADAVVAVRMQTSAITLRASEVAFIGTAVRLA